MSFLNSLFRRKAATPPVPPLQDPVLGRLNWDEDSEGWVADLPLGSGSGKLHIGAGAANEYPAEPLLALVRGPFQSYGEHCKRAFAHLQQNATFNAWKVDPKQLTPAGIVTYEHYLAERTYTILFAAPDESIWKVHFRDGTPTDWGVDD